jgi:hypothetical protein
LERKVRAHESATPGNTRASRRTERGFAGTESATESKPPGQGRNRMKQNAQAFCRIREAEIPRLGKGEMVG